MKTSKIPLDQVSVASPCGVAWDAMHGDEQVRFCGQCEQHVYNLSEMTADEAEALILKREGRMCVRFYKRADGTMLTRDCPVGWRAVKRRMALCGAAAVAVLVAGFGIVTLAFDGSLQGNGKGGVQLVNPLVRLRDWLFPPPPVMPPPFVMGVMCVPEPLDVPPLIDAPAPEVKN